MNKFNILVVGAGAIGTYIGGSLASIGNKITFLEQAKTIPDLKKHGLIINLGKSVKSIPGQLENYLLLSPDSFACASSVKDALHAGPFDFAIYALKSFDTSAVLEEIKPYSDDLPAFLCLSNGVDNEPSLARVLGAGKVIAGTVTSSVSKKGIGNITLERKRGVGLAKNHPLSLQIMHSLNDAGLNAILYKSAESMKWSKLLTNILVNASSAIIGMPPKDILSNPGLFKFEMRMLKEALKVMRVQGIRVVDTPKTPVTLLAYAVSLPNVISRPIMLKAVGSGRGGKMPSFYLDLQSGRGKSEVEWLNGAVVRYGIKWGIPTPINQFLTETLSSLSVGEIPQDYYLGQPNKFLSALI